MDGGEGRKEEEGLRREDAGGVWEWTGIMQARGRVFAASRPEDPTKLAAMSQDLLVVSSF